MRYLLDTDTCVAVLRGDEAAVARVREEAPDDLAVASITHYELLYGVERCEGRRRARERRKVEEFLGVLHELPFTSDTARVAATVRRGLENDGRPIGPMDLLIAATAKETNLRVITRNLTEFNRVPGLICETWRS